MGILKPNNYSPCLEKSLKLLSKTFFFKCLDFMVDDKLSLFILHFFSLHLINLEEL